ncbi:hypothetical protein C8J56DRAFT_927690 [Mycena floridula]|nr:hypothetical protein C8J56DRAFT_927690 [Mycena floridula]
MPSHVDVSSEEETTFYVLCTGFGPFSHYKDPGSNPSWLAVKPLHDTVIDLDEPSEPIGAEQEGSDIPKNRIHISALEVPVVYEAVLDTVPGLHLQPPILPPEARNGSFPTPPSRGYDLIFHIGVAGRGPLRLEKVGHKLGYQMKDASGKLAPLVESLVQDFNRNRDEFLGAVNMEMLAMDMVETHGAVDGGPRLNRGFGTGYEKFPEELYTDIDLTALVHDLKRQGVEQIYTSMDAGHYLCDFIYYCSLAESRRSAYEKGRAYSYEKGSTVLFMQCPPVGLPLSTTEVTDAIRRIIIRLARGL